MLSYNNNREGKREASDEQTESRNEIYTWNPCLHMNYVSSQLWLITYVEQLTVIVQLYSKLDGLQQWTVNQYASIGECISGKCCQWPWPPNQWPCKT